MIRSRRTTTASLFLAASLAVSLATPTLATDTAEVTEAVEGVGPSAAGVVDPSGERHVVVVDPAADGDSLKRSLDRRRVGSWAEELLGRLSSLLGGQGSTGSACGALKVAQRDQAFTPGGHPTVGREFGTFSCA